MNKLADADRSRLRRRAAELLYGSKTAPVLSATQAHKMGKATV